MTNKDSFVGQVLPKGIEVQPIIIWNKDNAMLFKCNAIRVDYDVLNRNNPIDIPISTWAYVLTKAGFSGEYVFLILLESKSEIQYDPFLWQHKELRETHHWLKYKGNWITLAKDKKRVFYFKGIGKNINFDKRIDYEEYITLQ
ncbi:MAG: hypothetical protein GF317_06010 [Candidatus Lokiarchaeota archaeon]|nr:hypothetical protein [Candidatus Lokiarchaeota archaeon]